MMRRGCADPITPPNPLSFFLQVKPQLEEKDKKPYPFFVALKYKTQVVAGTNYLIKVSTHNSNDEYVHLWVFQSLPHQKEEPSLTRYETGKTRDDPLEPF
uniref:Cystatin domain-containing protein n=1 Tax=Terrapene triunguis TaxID=2587831 RepID=A0A674JMX5_9SAUR